RTTAVDIHRINRQQLHRSDRGAQWLRVGRQPDGTHRLPRVPLTTGIRQLMLHRPVPNPRNLDSESRHLRRLLASRPDQPVEEHMCRRDHLPNARDGGVGMNIPEDWDELIYWIGESPEEVGDVIRGFQRQLEQHRTALRNLLANVIWMTGSQDFGPGGKAEEGFDRGVRPVIAECEALLDASE